MNAGFDVITLASGRRVGVHHFGNREALRKLVLCHAAPGSGAFDPNPAVTARRNAHLIAIDRPGYGASDRLGPGQWATVAGAANDIAAVLESLEITRVGVAGWSAGGRVALALAATHPTLVDRVAVIATPAPDDAVPWMADYERAGIEAMRGLSVDDARQALESQMRGAFPSEVTSETARMMLATSPADAEVLADPGTAERLTEMLRFGLAPGLGGMIDDLLGYTLQPWGFTPGTVDARTLLVYGTDDPVANGAHGRWWQQRLPDARLEMSPDAGHLLVVPRWERVLSHLAAGTLSMAAHR